MMKATKKKKVVGPLKWHGGKTYMAKDIIALMPPRCKTLNKPTPDDPGWLHYVEPFAGGLAVLLANDPEGISEVVNDTNQELAHFWYVLADSRCFDDFFRRVQCTPFSQSLWEKASTVPQHGIARMPVDSAADFFVRCRQSLAGRMKGFTGITRNRTRRGMNAEASAWISAVEGLPEVHARLMRVLILNKPALEVIKKEDGPRTLFYLDPPYLHSTRATTGEYEHEMSDKEHQSLLLLLRSIKGRFLLSGYRSPLYDCMASGNGWHRRDFILDNKAAGGAEKRKMTESVWMNYDPTDGQR